MQLEKMFDLAWGIDGNTISLEQDCGIGEVHRIDLHSIHVRLLASELGMFKGDEDAWRRVSTLERRMRMLLARIDRLDTLLLSAAERGHENLETETIYSAATLDLAEEFCAELGVTEPALQNSNGSVSDTQAEPRGNPAGTQRLSVGGHQPALPLEARE
jgi:hypothetical protein